MTVSSVLARSDLTELSVEELMNVSVTSVSKKPERRASVAEPVYVITGEEIRRSGMTSIPEALRLVPGVHVARISSNQWSIGIRGFANRLSRSVLVLIDGRSVYNPLFAGTYWELQDTVLEDIDRIEVIRGPGGTLWGANAFNGVINIITKDAVATQGGLLLGRGGSEEHGVGTFRYGGAVGETLHYRAYAKYVNRDGGAIEGDDFDDWRMARGGFRADWRPRASDWLTLQGDIYDGELGTRATIAQLTPPISRTVVGDADVSGGNVLGRWSRAFSESSNLTVQTYFDHTFRRDLNFREQRETFDVDAQHRWQFDLGLPHEVVWGFDYRLTTDETAATPGTSFRPNDRTDHLISGFAQNHTTLWSDRLFLTVGAKVEHNDYSGFEIQPNARLLLTASADHTLWFSVGRSVRTPSRIEHDLELLAPGGPPNCVPPACTFPRLHGNRDFKSEKLIAYQLGHRMQPMHRIFVDSVVFYQEYDNLVSIEAEPPLFEATPPPGQTIVPLRLDNKLEGASYGFEVAVDVFATDWWRIKTGYSYLRLQLHRDDSSTDTNVATYEGTSPHHQAFGRSELDLPWDIELDSDFRYVEGLPAQDVRSYVTFDVRLGVQLTDRIEISAVGQNLWDSDHREFAGGTEVERSAYGQVRYRW